MPTGVTEVDIRGPYLQQALADIHSDTEEVSFDEEPPQVAYDVPKCARTLLIQYDRSCQDCCFMPMML